MTSQTTSNMRPPTCESGASGSATGSDSHEVMYKIRKWSLDGTAIVPLLNVTSRVNWLELDDRALLAGFMMCCGKVSCVMSSHKSARRHGKVLLVSG